MAKPAVRTNPRPDDQPDPERGQTPRPDGPNPTTQPDPECGQGATALVSASSPITVTPLLTAKGGLPLASIYQAYETDVQAGSKFTPTSSQTTQYYFSGTSIKLDISVATGNLKAMLGVLKQLGMTVDATAIPGQVAIIEGFVPIAQLPTVAANVDVFALPPARRPSLN